MNTSTTKQIAKKFGDILKRFGRSGWKFTLETTNAGWFSITEGVSKEEAYATVSTYPDRDLASLKISSALGEEEDWILHHEAMHVVFSEVDDIVIRLEEHLSPELYRFVWRQYKTAMDAAINRVVDGVLEDVNE